jgi:anhydro-N-acetylmuramic acid kinase
MDSYKIIGLMSGTSLDGLDIALCEFNYADKWNYKILDAETISYDEEMRKKLASVGSGDAIGLARMNVSFGKFCGEKVADFIRKKNVKVDMVASHGHTIYHQPALGYTLQIGDGAALSAACSLPVVCDFRSLDVALGGQGAPLVPIGDKLLFDEFKYCLNLGGIANISFDQNGERIAFDICACNILFNYLAEKKGRVYDKNGELARSGIVHEKLLEELSKLEYYSRDFPKSLGREDVELILKDFIDSNQYGLSVEDLMATVLEHVAGEIARIAVDQKMLLTGGGTFNTVLVEAIKRHTASELIKPDDLLINYKEALIFAFLGLKRWVGEVNCLKSVTGANRDNIGGAIYLS